jgi:hypothetical protein
VVCVIFFEALLSPFVQYWDLAKTIVEKWHQLV